MIKRGSEPKVLALLVLQQSLFLTAGIGLWLWSGGRLDDLVRPGWFDLLLGVALACAFAGFFGLLFTLLPKLGERMAREQGETIFSTERPYGVGAILIISASAGIGEEALFRGGIQTLLVGWMPGWAAILLTTLLFTAAHPGSRMLMGFVAGLSLAFSLAFHWSGSLLAVMIAHALYDVFSLIWIQRRLRRLGHWNEVAAPAAAPDGSLVSQARPD